MSILWLDYETRSRCDLRSRGSYNYARDPSTQIICMAYAFDDEDVALWEPDQKFPKRVAQHFFDGGQIRAHNAGFDRLITEFGLCQDFKVPTPLLTQWYCTAAQARANCAPGSLEDVGRFASSSMRKDHRGNQLIRLLCIPRADGTFNTDPTLLAEMGNYAMQDVRTMRSISMAMRQLSPDELLDYHVNERINDRGVLLDKPLCEAAVRYASEELQEIEQIVAEVTEGAITSVRSPKMREWVLARVGDEAKKLMEVYKDGDKRYSIDKTVRANLLVFAEENPDEIPPEVADVIQCASDLWASSVAKFNRLKELADEDDNRVRGAFVFAGGSATGRASSYGAQLHNMPRKCAKNPTAVRQAMVRGHAIVPAFGSKVTDILKSMLRAALIPAKGKSLVVADWSAIEARVNPWLSMHSSSKDLLVLFESGKDIYVREAAKIFACTEDKITPEKRQLGKIAILSLGFAGAAGAFNAMSRAYGVLLPEYEIQRIIKAWRRNNQWAVELWSTLESAYTRAMRNVGHEITAHRITYLFDGLHLWYSLPSGRVLCYPYARLEDDGVTYAKAAWKPAADAKEWPRARLWKGLACENIVQATANDVLRHSLRVLEAEGFAITAHVHDEIIVECDSTDAERVKQRMYEVMSTPPEWASGLPLNAEINILQIYGK